MRRLTASNGIDAAACLHQDKRGKRKVERKNKNWAKTHLPGQIQVSNSKMVLLVLPRAPERQNRLRKES